MSLLELENLLGIKGKSFNELTELLQNLDKLKDKIVEVKTGIYKETVENFIKSDPEVVEINKAIDMGCVIAFLRSGRDHIDGGAIYGLNQKLGATESQKLLLELGLIDEEFWYWNERSGGYDNHKFENKKDRDSCFEMEDGVKVWCDPIRGVTVTEEVFEENTYSSYKTTEKYHNIAKRLSSALHA